MYWRFLERLWVPLKSLKNEQLHQRNHGIYVDFIRPIQSDDEVDLLEEQEEEYISSHLFNLEQAESVIDELNKYLEDAVSVGYLLKFLNDEADCIETVAMEPKEKKQRYVIVIVKLESSITTTEPSSTSTDKKYSVSACLKVR